MVGCFRPREGVDASNLPIATMNSGLFLSPREVRVASFVMCRPQFGMEVLSSP